MDLLHNTPDTFHLIQGLAVTAAAGSSGSVAPASEPLHLSNGGAGNPFTIVANHDQFVFSESPLQAGNNPVADFIQGQNLISPTSSANHWNLASETAANSGAQHAELGMDVTLLNHDTFTKGAVVAAQHVSDFHLVI